jgi:hypothetical protein
MDEKPLFITFMGDSPIARILDYLLTERDMDFSISDMARNSGIARASLYRQWNNLIRNDILIHTRMVGKAKLYRLNKENPIIKKLFELDEEIILKDMKRRAAKH